MSDDHNGLYPIPEFLKMYRSFPCLWDVRNDQYRNKKARDVALKQLMAMVGIKDINVLRKRIRSLRCTYNQEIAKIRLAPNFTPKLEWFSIAHSFLRKNDFDYRNEENTGDEMFQITPSSSPYDQFTMQVKEEPDEIWEPSKVEAEIEESVKRKRSVNSEPDLITQSKEPKMMNSTASPFPLPTPLSTFHCDTSDNPLRYEVDISALQNSSSTQTERDFVSNTPTTPIDDFKVFGQYIANQLQLLPLEDSLQLQFEMQSLVVQARMQYARRAKASENSNLNS